MPSPFATSLKRLLDETAFYDRAQWASFLDVPEDALEGWVSDRAIPTPDRLRMILDLLRTRGTEKAPVELFDQLAREPASKISPLLDTATLHAYLHETLADFGHRLRGLTIEEQQRVLTHGEFR